MEASASPKPDAEYHQVFGIFLKMEDSSFPLAVNQKGTIIRYTKLPDFDFDAKASWNPQSYTLQPRLRRIICLNNDDIRTNRSLRTNIEDSLKTVCNYNSSNRKIITISESDEIDLHPRFTNAILASPVKVSNRPRVMNGKDKTPPPPNKTTPRLPISSHHSSRNKYDGKEIKARVDTNLNRKEKNTTKPNNRESKTNSTSKDCNKSPKPLQSKDLIKNTSINKVNSSKSLNVTNENKEISVIKEMYNEVRSNASCKSPVEKAKLKKPPVLPRAKLTVTQDLGSASKPFTVVRMPVDDKRKAHYNMSTQVNTMPIETLYRYDRASFTDELIECRNMNVGTRPLPEAVDRTTETDAIEVKQIEHFTTSTQTNSVKEVFESLDIPNVTLTKDKSKSKENASLVKDLGGCLSSPDLPLPPSMAMPYGDLNPNDIRFCQSASYVYSRATVMYTTRQKINFHLLGNNEVISSPSPDPLSYPLNVVSVYKNELRKTKTINLDDSENKPNITSGDFVSLNKVDSLNCSYVCNKLMKPSDIISSIRINNGLLESDYICEQFQKELNFIDSFFESLQYLESCSLSDKCFSETKVENLVNSSMLFDSTFDVKSSEYNNFLAKLENGANIDDMETMASKSLCLLNLLIRDEQRRAKNLLFVLKMREDALKDFTKSQILWLEKKKKLENTDVSTLKKKQRGALLKLQHECGEMQRMRKALLALSEKRKQALMKTKKNIELQLNNDVDKIIIEKKKLKRTVSTDRNAAPLKCFELSSSGCEESTSSRHNSDATLLACELPVHSAAHSAAHNEEKCEQTAPASPQLHRVTAPAAHNFVAVDGGYLNILFHNLSLPQIFSSGTHYEVNEEALKTIVFSANNHNLSGNDIFDKLMDHVKSQDLDRSSTPSTARSLVEELDQYYKGLAEEEDKSTDSPDRVQRDSEKQLETKGTLVQIMDFKMETAEQCIQISSEPCVCEAAVKGDEMSFNQVPNGPLPVPVGAVASGQPDTPSTPPPKSVTETDHLSGQSLFVNTSIISLTAPVNVEAEELRRQQLAIEREIKALEQQQSRLLAVREIPDKPPPPYTPPTDSRTPRPRRMFVPDESIIEKVDSFFSEQKYSFDDYSESYEMFLKDFCSESMERHKMELSDKPWDACNLLPQKPQVQTEKLVSKTSSELNEVLTSVAPTVVSGVSSRRSDHIDDILFTEWRRCEPEWTALHTDEAIVKNQLFESIFQKLLSETVDEYKKTVQSDVVHSDC